MEHTGLGEMQGERNKRMRRNYFEMEM